MFLKNKHQGHIQDYIMQQKLTPEYQALNAALPIY
jgi:hypothetical protein